MADTGLFATSLDEGMAANILFGDLAIYKGAIYENVIDDCFSKNEKQLYYFSKSLGLEIDFISVIYGKLSLVEAKSRSGNAKSSKTVFKDK